MKRENDAGWLAFSTNLPGRDRNQVDRKGIFLGAWLPGFLKFSGPWSRLAITKGGYRALYGFIVLAGGHGPRDCGGPGLGESGGGFSHSPCLFSV